MICQDCRAFSICNNLAMDLNYVLIDVNCLFLLSIYIPATSSSYSYYIFFARSTCSVAAVADFKHHKAS